MPQPFAEGGPWKERLCRKGVLDGRLQNQTAIHRRNSSFPEGAKGSLAKGSTPLAHRKGLMVSARESVACRQYSLQQVLFCGYYLHGFVLRLISGNSSSRSMVISHLLSHLNNVGGEAESNCV